MTKDIALDRSTRASQTRESKTRQASSAPMLERLEAPTPPPGVRYKWVDYYLPDGKENMTSVQTHALEGWTEVLPENIEDPRFDSYKTIAKQRGIKYLQYKELVLMWNWEDNLMDLKNREEDRAKLQMQSLANPTSIQNIGPSNYVRKHSSSHDTNFGTYNVNRNK